jgi:hypothetical protein
MGLIENTARNIKQIVQTFAGDLFRCEADPAAKRGVDLENAAVRLKAQVAARRVFI